MRDERVAFLDWMKAIGITLIVYGHVTGASPFVALAPLYSKQLGVALFLFAAGFSLARESRGRWHAAYNRLFEMYLFGLACALLWSLVSWTTLGKVTRSNYLPFVLGLNVLQDAFPANPTTWYIGTYLHLVLLWALALHRLQVTAAILVGGFMLEVAIRALVVQTAGGYVAYMLLPNWTTPLLLGLWYGQGRVTTPRVSAPTAFAGLAIGLFVWIAVARALPFEPTFPFMRLEGIDPVIGAIVVSMAVSVLYATVPWLVLGVVGLWSAPGVVRFLARNTVILFIVHMPLYYMLIDPLRAAVPDRMLRATVMLPVCLLGPAAVSEGIRRVLRPWVLRDRLYTWATAVRANAWRLRRGAEV
jgi:hypothetical protein